METGITLSNREVTPQVWEQINTLAPTMHMSRIFGVTSKEQAAAVMLKGYELGFSLSTSFEFIQIVDGKPSLSPRGALALLHNSKELEGLKITRLVDGKGNFAGYECWMKRKGGFEHASRFTLEDARKAGLIKAGGNWEKYPENMCMWRCIGFDSDVVAPDITGGLTLFLKMPETESVQVSATGDFYPPKIETRVIDGDYSIPAEFARTTEPTTLDSLVATWGADKVMEAAGGQIPQTEAEIDAVMAKLF